MRNQQASGRLAVVEICAGAGGQSLGLHLAGFEHTLAVELDADAAATLKRNLSRLAAETGRPMPTVAVGDVADESVWRPSDHRGISLLAGEFRVRRSRLRANNSDRLMSATYSRGQWRRPAR